MMLQEGSNGTEGPSAAPRQKDYGLRITDMGWVPGVV